jgi:hypothetical protein
MDRVCGSSAAASAAEKLFPSRMLACPVAVIPPSSTVWRHGTGWGDNVA